MTTYSIVLIAQNEQVALNEALQSVQRAAAEVGPAEIVYVDLGSSDQSIALAKSLGVRALGLRSGHWQTYEAGCFFGFHETSGELLMLIKGALVVDRMWLSRALAFFADSTVAGVTGLLDGASVPSHSSNVPTWEEGAQQLNVLRGSSVYRRSMLQAAKVFDPGRKVADNLELATRLNQVGGKLLQLPFVMGRPTGSRSLGLSAYASTSYRTASLAA